MEITSALRLSDKTEVFTIRSDISVSIAFTQTSAPSNTNTWLRAEISERNIISEPSMDMIGGFYTERHNNSGSTQHYKKRSTEKRDTLRRGV